MSKPKKLNLTLEKLKEIAQLINNNTISNRSKKKEDKITTDIFIKQFGIARKDFSETIKDTNINYNKSTFQYDIGDVNFPTTKVNLKEVNKSSDKVNHTQPVEKQREYQEKNARETQSIQKNTFQLPNEFKELLSLTGDLKEMVGWYKKQTNTNIVDIPELNINNSKLDGEIVTRSFKMYKEIAGKFSKFAETRKEKQKDLISIAILEFINKYKR